MAERNFFDKLGSYAEVIFFSILAKLEMAKHFHSEMWKQFAIGTPSANIEISIIVKKLHFFAISRFAIIEEITSKLFFSDWFDEIFVKAIWKLNS